MVIFNSNCGLICKSHLQLFINNTFASFGKIHFDHRYLWLSYWIGTKLEKRWIFFIEKQFWRHCYLSKNLEMTLWLNLISVDLFINIVVPPGESIFMIVCALLILIPNPITFLFSSPFQSTISSYSFNTFNTSSRPSIKIAVDLKPRPRSTPTSLNLI